MEIEGCVAVITGGASGLGEACVRDLARLGAKGFIMDIENPMLNGATIGALRMTAR